MLRTLSALYLLLQGVAATGFWIFLLIKPEAAMELAPPSLRGEALMAFAPADLALFALGSVVASVGLQSGKAWSRPAVFFVAGVTMTSSLIFITAYLRDGMPLAYTIGVLPPLILPPLIALTVKPGRSGKR